MLTTSLVSNTVRAELSKGTKIDDDMSDGDEVLSNETVNDDAQQIVDAVRKTKKFPSGKGQHIAGKFCKYQYWGKGEKNKDGGKGNSLPTSKGKDKGKRKRKGSGKPQVPWKGKTKGTKSQRSNGEKNGGKGGKSRKDNKGK